MRSQKCVICGCYMKSYGHNPRPVKDKGECCDSCNMRYVVPARIAIFRKKELEKRKWYRKYK